MFVNVHICRQHKSPGCVPLPLYLQVTQRVPLQYGTRSAFKQHRRVTGEPEDCRLCCRAAPPPLEFVTGGPLTGTIPVDLNKEIDGPVPELPEVHVKDLLKAPGQSL